MGIFDFFSSIVTNFRNHYIQLANSPALRHASNRTTVPADSENAAHAAALDTYEPTSALTGDPAAIDTTELDLAQASDRDTIAENEPAPESTEEPSGTEAVEQPYRFRHHTHFDYEVRLEFQLRAIAAIAQEIADGETVTSEELAAAGFGLKAAMDFSGMRLEEARETEAQPLEGRNGARLLKARGATAFAVQERNFALESFSREALKVKQTLNANSSEHYQRAVTKFSLRFRLDNQFSFAYLNRFNVQTQKVADNEPQSVEQYVDAAGDVAEKGSVDMMAAFFDAVDAYLDQAEEQLLVRAGEFFDLAAQQLGLSDQALASKEHLMGSIESFFDQVESAVDFLQSKFVTPPVEPDMVNAGLPLEQAIALYSPTVAEQPGLLAFA